MEDLINFSNIIIDAMQHAKDSFDSFAERAVLWLIIFYFKLKIHTIEFAYTIASSIISSIGIQNTIQSAWGSIDGDIMAVMNYCRVPDALNLILSAFVTKFVLDILPW